MQQGMIIGVLARRLPISNAWSDSRISNFTRSNNNFTVSESTLANAAAMTYRGRSSGKFYWETGMSVSGTPFDCAAGIRREDEAIGTAVNAGQTLVMRANGTTFVGSTGATAGTASSFTSGARVMHALDLFNLKYWVGVNGTWANSGNPAAGTGALFTGFSAGVWHPYVWTDNSAGNHTIVLYNGQVENAFAHTVPDGFERGMRY